MKIHTFGIPAQDDWRFCNSHSLSKISGILETLTDREVEYMDERGINTYGDHALALRLDLVEKARELIEVADSGNLKIMRRIKKQIHL